jgi:hypothetical protein
MCLIYGKTPERRYTHEFQPTTVTIKFFRPESASDYQRGCDARAKRRVHE